MSMRACCSHVKWSRRVADEPVAEIVKCGEAFGPNGFSIRLDPTRLAVAASVAGAQPCSCSCPRHHDEWEPPHRPSTSAPADVPNLIPAVASTSELQPANAVPVAAPEAEPVAQPVTMPAQLTLAAPLPLPAETVADEREVLSVAVPTLAPPVMDAMFFGVGSSRGRHRGAGPSADLLGPP